MLKRQFSKVLSASLAAILLTQSIGLSAYAAEEDVVVDDNPTVISDSVSADNQPTADAPVTISDSADNGLTRAANEPVNVVIPSSESTEKVNEILTKALLGENSETQNWEYYCTGKSKLLTNNAWGSIGGFTSTKKVGLITTTYTHPALSNNTDGQYQVRVVDDTQNVYTIYKKKKMDVPVTVKENAEVKLLYNDDMTVNYDDLRSQILSSVLNITDDSFKLDANDVTITYYATATSGSLGDIGKNWAPLNGGTVSGLKYPAISEGQQQIKLSWRENNYYFAKDIEATVTVKDREKLQFKLKEQPYNVGLVFKDKNSYDYDATAQAIYDAVVDSTSPEINADEVKVEYDARLTNIKENYKPLNNKEQLTKQFGIGTWKIKLSWTGNKDYAGNSVEVNVNIVDNRIQSTIVLKENVSFTYNKDVSVMKQAVLDNVIDWEKSSLPAKDAVSIDDFNFTYNAPLYLADGADSNVSDDIIEKILGKENLSKKFVPFEGQKYELSGYTLGSYPQIGAGEQQIKVSYKGNKDYKQSEEAQGNVTINKAKVKVSVKSTSMPFSSAKTGLNNIVSTDPDDKFDMYILYAGITGNVTTNIYLQLPAKYTKGTFVQVSDKVLAGLKQPTLTEIMQNGITVGELRKMLKVSEVIEALEKLGVDTGALGQLITVVDKLPAIGDNIRVSIGIPNNAGIYTVTAITDNKNYNTGVGVGALVLKKEKAALVWNQDIGKKISAADAKNADFAASLKISGETVNDQTSVHVLYSGFTSKWRPYSSTTTPPTEPGRYTMTVVVIGGNYTAAPITRSFQITK